MRRTPTPPKLIRTAQGWAAVRPARPSNEAPARSATAVQPLSPAIEARRRDRTRQAIMQTRVARGYRTDDVGPLIGPKL
jgi:hypothetical protein